MEKLDKGLYMLKDVVISLKKQVLERIASPLAGAFVLSWGCWNWKLLATLFFGREDIALRIEAVTTKYYDLDHLIIKPAYSTGLIIFLYPLLSLIAFSVWEGWGIAKRKVATFFDEETPPNRGEYRRLSILLRENEQNFRDQLDGKDRLVESLREEKQREIVELKKEIEILRRKDSFDGKNIDLSDSDKRFDDIAMLSYGDSDDNIDVFSNIKIKDREVLIDILKVLSRHGAGIHVPTSDIAKFMKIGEAKATYYLDQLSNEKFINKRNDYSWLTEKGRKFLYENDMLQ